jgi:ferredoxin
MHGCATLLARVDPATLPPADAVAYDSRGVVLVLGDGPAALEAAAPLAAGRHVVVFAPGADRPADAPSRLTVVGGRITRITGHLGAFRACARLPDGAEADIDGFSANRDGTFDLVLDLRAAPLLRRSVPPPGYFAPGLRSEALARALAQIERLHGRFTKPRFFRYDERLCAHGGSGFVGCARCLQVCGAEAIRSKGDRIEVDPHLCQGCAACTLACPTGALTYASPSRTGLRQRVAEEIANARAASGDAPVLVVHAPAAREALQGAVLPRAARPIEVPALPAFGEELWLEALAAGAGRVVLVADDGLPSDSGKILAERVALANEILRALGQPIGGVVVADVATAASRSSVAAMPSPTPPGNAHAPGTKRAALLEAFGALRTAAALEPVVLPAGAPFGEVVVDRDKCTVCFACVQLCPTRALAANETDGPELRFVEARCVQCGLCEIGCPEQAIRLVPRFVPDPAASGEARLRAATDMARCVECATPFISRKVLESTLARIKDHPTAQGEGLRRLRMCPECRRRAASAT